MARENLLSVSDICNELNAGRASVKFILKRFSPLFDCQMVNGQPCYAPADLKRLLEIHDQLETGMLPSDIEKDLMQNTNSDSDDTFRSMASSTPNEDIRLSRDGLNLIKSLVQDIGEQQKRIAIAHEKRAAAEERKASAIEKRADAEEKKAEAMNNIAAALQEMNQLRLDGPEARRIVHKAATVITADETVEEAPAIEMDDLSELIDPVGTDTDTQIEEVPLPDENELFEEFSDADTLSDPLNGLLDELDTDIELDNLSLLTDDEEDILSLNSDILEEDLPEEDLPKEPDEPKQPDKPAKTDDLSLLVDDDALKDASQTDIELQDLSLLIDIDENALQETDTLDDLSQLIDPEENEPESAPLEPSEPQEPLDDLSALIESPAEKNNADGLEPELDDLSLLIDDPISSKASPDDDLDDLSKLIDAPAGKADTEPEIKIDLTPEEDLEKYKAAVMKLIIGLKGDGLSVDQTVDRLNKNQVRTISGRPEWSSKAISQIYKFIDSAK